MKLDARIFKNPLTGFDFEIAKQFIGKPGYFGDSVEDFYKLDKLKHGELRKVDEFTGDFTYGDNANHDFSIYFLPDEYVNPVKPVEEDITLAKLLSELKVLKYHRVVIYDGLENMVFDSDDLELFNYYEYWKLLEEKVRRFADITRDGRRSIFIFMCD